jgi:HAMP domain-containing protein/CheY-like chemotaxis protein/signal transduction histidine kinase
MTTLLATLTAYKNGDFSVRMPSDWTGLEGKIADTLNDIIDMTTATTVEFERVARLVGKQGKVAERINLPMVKGSWQKLVSSSNTLTNDLVSPMSEVIRVIGGVAEGDLNLQVPLEIDGLKLQGQFLKSAQTVNTMVTRLGSFASEVTRVAREVGTEGKLGGQASVKGVAGTWKELTDNVNAMAGNLTVQLRDVFKVASAVANGDLTQRMTVEARGEILLIKEAKNRMVDQLSGFATEVTRLAREVGTDGKLGGQAEVKDVAGTWKDLTDSVNTMAGNLTVQLRDVFKVASAVANGDLTQRMTVEARGEILLIKEAKNRMVDQLSGFATEVTRLAREVGTDGKLGGQAEVKDVAGTWKDLTDSVNTMAGNLTVQLRDVSKVATAIARGDLSQKITVDVQGEILQVKDVINTMVDQLGSFASEVTRVAREVGTDGKLGGQALVPGVAGTWKDLTENVNAMAGNLTVQLRDVSKVAAAIARGDLGQKITVDVKGEILEIKETINKTVDQLGLFASEVTRVAREVGTEGKLGGQAQVKGVAGTWKDLTESVNAMAGNLTVQLRDVSKVATAIAKGDLSQKITVDVKGEILQIKDTINTMVDQLGGFASEVTRVAREVGTEGMLGGQAQVPGVAGTWKDLTESVNAMAGNLTVQLRDVSKVATAIAKGDLSQKITVNVKGEILQIKDTINTMVDQLGLFASEVTRVAREVGTEGKLGGQAEVKDVAGTWKDLTESVNATARNLTVQLRDVSKVATAIAKGDLSQKITVDVKGEILQIKETINKTVDQLGLFASEVTRVAREVGTEGKLGGQAQVKGVAGTWKDLTESVNAMAGNLTVQLRDVSKVATAIAKGDLSQKITVDVKGEILQIKDTINTMVDQLGGFASEVTRVAREVGTEGLLGGQAQVPDVAGTWKDLTDSVNAMAGNLTVQLRDVSKVATAIAKGDLSQKITVDVKGEILEIKDTINTMVDQLGLFASEVTRVAREVGTEGKLGGQAEVKDVAGTWKDLTDSVNAMAGNLTVQLRDVSKVATAIAKGDLSQQITVDVKGEILQIKDTINTMVDQLGLFASEVTRVAREVGTEGKLGGQAQVKDVAGTWKDLTESVNAMAGNLTVQLRDVSKVATAIAKGDLGQQITVDVKGEILEIKETINKTVEQLGLFASEVTRVAREVGTDGKLGGQAQVPGVAGTWKDLTDSVNMMASNLTAQVRNIAEVTTSVASGDLSKKITVDVRGEILLLKETMNTMVDQLRAFASEVTRVAREVGMEGRLGGQAFVTGVAGTWKDLTDSVNMMGSNLTDQVRNIATVTTAVANGDLSKKITVDVKGEILELKNTINTMVDQLNSFSAEVTRVAREVGTEGKLGGQAVVRGVSGTWKDLTDNVNFMAANLTSQVRGIAKVVTSVANGDLKRKLTVEAKGEIADLADTINNMTDTLALFTDQVTSVAREVGVDGKLGGQANVPGAAGTWKALTDNVNQLAANLSTQVRAIAEVATAVTKGDLTRSIQVEARGEVSELKDNVNEMIRNLRETTQQNSEQDWLKTNLAKFTRLLQGQRDLTEVSKTVLSELAPLVNGQHGVFYMMDESQPEAPRLQLLSAFAFKERKNLAKQWALGEGLVGQCAAEKQRILLTNVPGDYIEITSGLGEARPLNIIVMPIIFETKVRAVVELASFTLFSQIHQAFLDQLGESIGIVLNTIEANMRTEELLKQSQSLAQELQSGQEELRQTNEELEEKARLLEEQKIEVERKNREVETAKMALEEKAEQLSLTSKYKSEFLSNMSHELRTPLNSLLILAQQLSENAEQNLNEKQVEYAKTIQGSGKDLLALINEILDLSKIESGTVALDLAEVSFGRVAEQLERTFRHVADSRGLRFAVEMAPELPDTLYTDEKRLLQVLKNLLSNAFKFTDKGRVAVRIERVSSGWSVDHPGLNSADSVIAFAVTDTGIGVPAEKQKIIFEAFQQADTGTARKYGGTGLGLSISREIARLLDGELRLTHSEAGNGSTFVLFIPLRPSGQGGRGNPPAESISERRGAKLAGAAAPTEVARSGRVDGEAEAARVSSEATARDPMPAAEVADDRMVVTPGDRTLLIVEDDVKFAGILLDTARQKGFKGIVATRGMAALQLADRFKPTAITLDLELPDIDGWVVLERLKRNPDTRHIPVDIISVEDNRSRGLRYGAFEYLVKPVTADAIQNAMTEVKKFAELEMKDLLVADADEAHRNNIIGLIGNGDVRVKAVATGKEALAALKKKRYDCMVLDLNLGDMSGAELLETVQANELTRDVPIIVYGLREMPQEEQNRLKALAGKGIVKDVHSPERLLDETALFLHRVVSRLPEDRRKMLEKLYQSADSLAGKKVLVVDDDVRNIFALTSVLERNKMEVVSAENGRTAIERLKQHADTDIVLMDIMMPEMDGLATMSQIRKIQQFESLPMIALTAKAMKGDREKCIEAGASDYVSKPVDTDQLLSLMRVWLYR